jgi:hypothetical protein
MNVYKIDQIDMKSLSVQNPHKIGKIYYGKLLHNSTQLYLQTPRIHLLTDVKTLDSKKNPFIECELLDTGFSKFLKSLDEYFINTVYSSCNDWFTKDIPREAVVEMYKKLVKSNKIRIRIPVIDNELQFRVFNEDNVFVDYKDIECGKELVAILHFRGIKFLSGNCVCDFYMNQCKVFSKPSLKYTVPDVCLIDNDNGGSDDEDIVDHDFLQEVQKQEKRKQLLLEKEKELSEIARLSERIKSLENDIQKI